MKRYAAKEHEAVSRKIDRQRIVQRIRALADHPRPPRSEKLAGHNDRFRIRQGPYRILYRIDDTAWIVEIFKVGHRREVYR